MLHSIIINSHIIPKTIVDYKVLRKVFSLFKLNDDNYKDIII